MTSINPKWYVTTLKVHSKECKEKDKTIPASEKTNPAPVYTAKMIAAMIEDVLLHNPNLQIHTLAAILKPLVKERNTFMGFQGGPGKFPVSTLLPS